MVPAETLHFPPAQVELQPNPLNIFQNLYQREIGTQLSFFYIAWANCYLKENDFKLAESAINWGFQKQAKPLEELQSAQQQVASSYFEFTQRQRPGPYQIVMQQQSPANPQPPLPAQVATNYQRDKRKLEDTFPVHTVGAHQGGSVKRSRPNETDYNGGQYVPSGGNYHNSNHYGQPAKVAYQNYAQPQHQPLQQHSHQQQQQQHQHQPYVHPHPQMSGVGHENGKNPNNPHHYHQQGSVVYQQPHQQQVQQPYPPYQSPHQNGHGQTQTTSQYHHEQTPTVHTQQQVVYQPVSSISNCHNQSPEVMSTSCSTTATPGQPLANNGYGDLHNSGYAIASSLNYVYDDYHQAGGGVVEEEVVVEQPQDQATTNGLEVGIQLPENFARSATNSHHICRAPLFLEDDPNRRPMYVKEQVYPVLGNEASGRCENEFSFEELRKNKRLASRATTSGPTLAEEGDPDNYVEYWTEEVTVQADDFNSHGNVISGRVVSDSAYGEYVQGQGQENVYYHVMEPKERKSKSSSKKKKGKRKKMIVQINDASDEDEEDEEDDDACADDAEYDAVAGCDEETTTIRYTCDQNGLSGTGAQAGSGRITIKLRKQITTPSSVPTTSKVPFGNGQNGKSSSSSNGFGTAIYKRTATDADADLLLSLGNGQSGYYQEMKPTAAYNEDSSSYSEYNASYNSSVYLGENSNSGPSTPSHSYQHHRQQMASVSATSTPAYRRLTKHRSNVSLMNDDSMTMNENSFFQGELDEEVKSRRLAKALATIEEHLGKSSIDPFNAELCKALLTKIGFPSAELCDVYRMVQQPLPKLSNAKQALLGDTYYNVEKEVGRGTYGAVYKAVNVYTGATVAIKLQKPANSWELYICNEIKKRITYHDIVSK